MKNINIIKMVFSAIFLSLAFVLPFLTGQIPEIGSMLCPMHIPVLLCGYVCGWKWGLTIGISAPILRSLTLGMPPIFPTAVCMAFELATYGAICAIAYKMLPKKKIYTLISLVIAMVSGRVVWGLAMLVCTNIAGTGFSLGAFITGAITNSIPAIIIQLIFIPTTIILLEKTTVFDILGDRK